MFTTSTWAVGRTGADELTPPGRPVTSVTGLTKVASGSRMTRKVSGVVPRALAAAGDDHEAGEYGRATAPGGPVQPEIRVHAGVAAWPVALRPRRYDPCMKGARAALSARRKRS
jgi:hypothetical protein